jgi:hypothetical protein
MLFFCHFGDIWAPPNRPKKILKGFQVGGMYGAMSELKIKRLNKLLCPFFRSNGPKQPENRFHKVFWVILGPFGYPQLDPQRYIKALKWGGGRYVWPNV